MEKIQLQCISSPQTLQGHAMRPLQTQKTSIVDRFFHLHSRSLASKAKILAGNYRANRLKAEKLVNEAGMRLPTPLEVEALLHDKATLYIKDTYGHSEADWASAYGHEPELKQLSGLFSVMTSAWAIYPAPDQCLYMDGDILSNKFDYGYYGTYYPGNIHVVLPQEYVARANQLVPLGTPNTGIVLLNPFIELCGDGRIVLHPRDENDVIVQSFLTGVVPGLSGEPVSNGFGLGQRNQMTNIAEPVSKEELHQLMKSGQVWEFHRPTNTPDSGAIFPIIQSAISGYAGNVSAVRMKEGAWQVLGVPLNGNAPSIQPESAPQLECHEAELSREVKALPAYVEEADWSVADEKHSLLKTMTESVRNIFSQ